MADFMNGLFGEDSHINKVDGVAVTVAAVSDASDTH